MRLRFAPFLVQCADMRAGTRIVSCAIRTLPYAAIR
jgi:hypothetical protein